MVYHQASPNEWQQFDRFFQLQSTRCHSQWFHNPVPTQPLDLTQCYPTMVVKGQEFISSHSSLSQFPGGRSIDKSTWWDPTHMPPPLRDTPFFSQRLIGDAPPTNQQCTLIQEGIRDQSLLSCSDRAYCPNTKNGSHSWIFATTGRQHIAEGAGPADGHPISMSSYHTEPGGSNREGHNLLW